MTRYFEYGDACGDEMSRKSGSAIDADLQLYAECEISLSLMVLSFLPSS